MGRRVLVVDDEQDIRELLGIRLAAAGYLVHGAASGREAIEVQTTDPADALVLDQKMPDMTGLAVARRLHALGHEVPMVLYSAFLDPAVKREATTRGLTTVAKGNVQGLLNWLAGALNGSA